ncbi:MAG: 2-C-methyl-D-erythritol 4-phosphate cytidylyltransferase [Oscillospiraceae bacterium]|nr:2-C-methyl-D-erythritol 4-phosphate cytidylyltransferase [Oscillospiraceae bacterium]
MFSAIILAAGSSSRMEGTNKQLAKIADTPVFIMSALAFQRSDKVSEIIIAAPADETERFERMARNYGLTKLKAAVGGGATRALSVKAALECVSEDIAHVAVHDGARPLITTEEIDRVLCDAEEYGAAIGAVKATDTVKVSDADGFVEATPPRETLYYAQTPQAFSKALYLECLEALGDRIENATDDSSIFEMCGKRVKLTEICCCNMKITRPDDLAAAQAIYDNRRMVKGL